MTLPRSITLVRHGESEGNVATKLSKHNDDSAFTPEFKNRHSSLWRLTETGIQQAKSAGIWLKQNNFTKFDRYYTSSHLRAMETAAYLDLDHAKWYRDINLRERDYGDIDVITHQERNSLYPKSMQQKKINSFYWTPPNGESMPALYNRLRWFLDMLHRECTDKDVIVVCHGEVMWGFRMLLERMPVERFLELDESKHPHDRIHNCQILQYERLAGNSMVRFRSICPWDTSLSSNDWQWIERKTYSNTELLELVEQTPRLLDV